jgi:hypothetical protein
MNELTKAEAYMEELADVEAAFEGLDERAASYGYGSADKMMSANYGAGVNAKLIHKAYEASMLANNTSCFNYRRKAHMSSVSRHAYGEAVDINPLYNPYYRVTAAGARIVEPASAAPYVDRSADFPYKIERGDLCHRLFLEHGFHWGGSWTRSKDYQHFER